MVEDRNVVQTVSISNVDDQTIRVFLNHNVSSSKVKDALTQSMSLKAKLAEIQRDLGHQNQLLRDITQDQGRLRANLKEMPATAAAYKRYLEKFDKQETEIELLQDKIKQLQAREFQQKQDLDAYLSNLSVE